MILSPEHNIAAVDIRDGHISISRLPRIIDNNQRIRSVNSIIHKCAHIRLGIPDEPICHLRTVVPVDNRIGNQRPSVPYVPPEHACVRLELMPSEFLDKELHRLCLNTLGSEYEVVKVCRDFAEKKPYLIDHQIVPVRSVTPLLENPDRLRQPVLIPGP